MIPILILIFISGYAAIAFEHTIKINKAASALITGVLCWTVYILFAADKELVSEQLAKHMGDVSGILFFLLGAMTIVELIDAHDGFHIITSRITQTNKVKLLWVISFITFFLSAIVDNLTSVIIIISLLRKLINDRNDRLFFAGIAVIAANAGGSWSPVGDVTTTMLWIGGQISALNIIFKLILPAIVCLLIPLIILSFKLRGRVSPQVMGAENNRELLSSKHQLIVLITGFMIFMLVPVFKTLTHLPPYMGILIGLGILWIITEIIHGDKDTQEKNTLSVTHALRRIDTPSILFFLGILISVAALESAEILTELAQWLTAVFRSDTLIVLTLGFLSSIVDNVPLVAAAQGMYSLDHYHMDHFFWEFLAYATGTGGSILVIGSAAGVAAMGMEKIDFFWYLRKIGVLAIAGFLSGAVIYILQDRLFG